MKRHDTWLSLTLVALALPCVTYGGAYVWARATLRLVFYSNGYGGFVARPHVLSGIGFSLWELIFAPLAWAEGALRSLGHG
jgi:hypothetical protein